MFSQTADYALRAVVCLSQSAGRPQTTRQIADHTRVPTGYLYKVLQALGRAALVASRRGLYGGYTLSRPPERICLLDVINAVHPIQRIATCPLGLAAHERRFCKLHRRLDLAIATIERAFAETSIADLLTPDTAADQPLCDRSPRGAAPGLGAAAPKRNGGRPRRRRRRPASP